MLRRTKIVATFGPATDDVAVIDKLIEAGMDVVRLNFSHGKPEDHVKRAELVRSRAREHRRPVGVLADLQGPKIRIGSFKNGPVRLVEGETFVIDVNCPLDAGDKSRVGTTYTVLPRDVERGTSLLLDDGRIVLQVDQVVGSEVICRVVVGGDLSDKKGINRQGGGLSARALTAKDHDDIRTAGAMLADYLAVSFVRSAADIQEARALFHAAGGKGGIVAKIERAEAVKNIEEILDAADAVMVARGDLAVEIGDAAVPPVQKRIIKLARRRNRVVITATQMLESMIENAIPTRAEVSDVANAVLDGTDAVMLSAETASGRYPVEAVAAMDRVCLETEKHEDMLQGDQRMEHHFANRNEAVARAVMYVANHLPVKAIIALTESGSTALMLTRINSAVPVYALTPHVETRRKVTLYRSCHPVRFEMQSNDPAEVIREAVNEIKRREAVRDGDLVILTIGEPLKAPGGTNTLKIVRVGELH
jgi:pyruvate kinase